MGLTNMAKVLKYLLLLFNLIFFICGIAMICIGAAISIKFEFTPGLLHHLDAEEDIGFKALTSAPIACVIAGIVVVLVVLFGCIGAWREGVCLLGLFSFLLIICCIIQFGSAAALASWKSIDDNHEKIVEEHFSNLIEHYNPDPDHKISTTAIDAMQTTLKCCGNHGISDWKTNAHINNTVDLTVWNLPNSCCSPDRLAESTCDSNIAKTSLYDVGCKDKFSSFIEENSKWLVGSVVTIALLEVLGIIFSCLLIKRIRQTSAYEPQFNSYN